MMLRIVKAKMIQEVMMKIKGEMKMMKRHLAKIKVKNPRKRKLKAKSD
jgi:hypothetical protein